MKCPRPRTTSVSLLSAMLLIAVALGTSGGCGPIIVGEPGDGGFIGDGGADPIGDGGTGAQPGTGGTPPVGGSGGTGTGGASDPTGGQGGGPNVGELQPGLVEGCQSEPATTVGESVCAVTHQCAQDARTISCVEEGTVGLRCRYENDGSDCSWLAPNADPEEACQAGIDCNDVSDDLRVDLSCNRLEQDEPVGACHIYEDCDISTAHLSEGTLSRRYAMTMDCEVLSGDDWTCRCDGIGPRNLVFDFQPQALSGGTCAQAIKRCKYGSVVLDETADWVCVPLSISSEQDACSAEVECGWAAELDGRFAAEVIRSANVDCEPNATTQDTWDCSFSGQGVASEFQVQNSDPQLACDEAVQTASTKLVALN